MLLRRRRGGEEGKGSQSPRTFYLCNKKKTLSRRGRLYSVKAIHMYVQTENVKKPPIVNS